MRNLITGILLISLSLQACKKSSEDSLKPPLTSQSDIKTLAAGSWTRKADRPGFAGAFYGVQFSIDGLVYMGYGGHESGNDPTFWEYNPSTDSWTQKANSQGGHTFSEMASFSIGRKGYYATGGQGDQSNFYGDEFFEYDPAANVWTRKANFPGEPRRRAIGFSVENKAYIGLGYLYDVSDASLTYYTDLWEYTPKSDCWTRKTDVPLTGNDISEGISGVVFGLGKYGYFKSGGSSQDFWQFNPASNQWIKKADFPGVGRTNAVGFAVGDKGYIGTGRRYGANGSEFLKDFWEYNPESDQWLQQADFSVSTNGAFGAGTKNKGYIKPGESDRNTRDNTDFWEFDPSGFN
ncbi:MAG: type sorting protein [Sphingobacteriales bacterium]|nr:type sorting protein [Sphingobacteriales bacterium]